MKNIIDPLEKLAIAVGWTVTTILLVCGSAFIFSGCLTSTTPVVTSATGTNGLTVFSTNSVTKVNPGALALWTAAAQGGTTMAVNTVLIATKNNPKVISDLKSAKVALDAVIGGASTATTQDILNALKVNGDPNLTMEVTNLVASVSSLEQQALGAAGSTPAGEISLAFAKAVDAGITTPLMPYLAQPQSP